MNRLLMLLPIRIKATADRIEVTTIISKMINIDNHLIGAKGEAEGAREAAAVEATESSMKVAKRVAKEATKLRDSM